MKMLQAYNIADTCNQIGDLANLQMKKKLCCKLLQVIISSNQHHTRILPNPNIATAIPLDLVSEVHKKIKT